MDWVWMQYVTARNDCGMCNTLGVVGTDSSSLTSYGLKLSTFPLSLLLTEVIIVHYVNVSYLWLNWKENLM